MSKKLILIRHGESLWNYQKKFTGWANIGLTRLGEEQAVNCGKILLKKNILPLISYTSTLKRSINTNSLILNEIGLTNKISVINSWRLNEKHYGKITGYTRDKDIKWKGNYFDIPPFVNSLKDFEILKHADYNPVFGESYYMTFLRVLPLWNEIKPQIINNQIPLICAHNNSLKVLIQYIEKTKLESINDIYIPNAKPLIYFFDDKMNFIRKKFLE